MFLFNLVEKDIGSKFLRSFFWILENPKKPISQYWDESVN